MGYARSSLLCVALVLALCSTIDGLDITKVLEQYPNLSQFNKLLTETKLAEEINKRNAVTVLTLDDAAMASLSGKSVEAVKSILSTHVLPDFWDEKKLVVDAVGSHAKVETLFQSSGAAKADQGYIYVALIGEGEVAFASAAAPAGAEYDVMLIRTVTTQPETLSVLQVSKVIATPGIETENAAQIILPATDALSPSALAPAPSSASRLCIRLLALASAIASLLMLSF